MLHHTWDFVNNYFNYYSRAELEFDSKIFEGYLQEVTDSHSDV